MAESVQAAAVNFPPGFRFRPSDDEIVGFYLKNKVQGNKFEYDVIREIDLYKCEPWDLPEKSFLPSRDLEWYFFCPRDRKYPNGSRSNRATEAGYWKATGKDRKVGSRSNKIGRKKTLVFYKGRAPHGERTNWLMHEYRLEGTQCKGGTNLQDLYVLSRVFRKPKQGLNDQEPTQEAFWPVSNNNLSPTEISDEDQSERSSPAKQEDDTRASSGLRSETSSEILDNKAEDNCIDGPMESLQDRSNPSCNLVSLHETSINTNDDSQRGSQKLQSDSFYSPGEEINFPEIPVNACFDTIDYLPWNHMNSFGVESNTFDGNFHDADAFNQDSLDIFSLLHNFENCHELDTFQFSTDEEKNDEPCVAGFPTSMVDNGVPIQIRSRPQIWQGYQQPLPAMPTQGTAMRRLRLQIHKTEESADGRKEHRFTVNSQSASDDCDSDDSNDSEVLTQLEDSPLASLSSQISRCVVEDNGGSPVTEYQYIADGADSDIVHKSVESSERVAKTNNMNLAQTQLLPFSLFPVGETSEKSDMSVNSEESGDKSVLIERSEYVMSSASSQSSSTEYQLEMTVSHPTSSHEMESVSVNSSALGMESPTVLASNKVSVSEVAVSFGSRQLGAINSKNIDLEEIHMSNKGSGKFTGFNAISSGLKLRGKSRENYVASDQVEESRIITENFSDRCSKDSRKGFSSLKKALSVFIQPSQLQSKISKGTYCISLKCLLSTVVLVLCIWTWHSARSSSTSILQ